MDEPKFISLTPNNDRLELKFELPQTINYELEFTLYELINQQLEFCSASLKYNSSISKGLIIFDCEISSIHKVEYKVKYRMKKNGFKTIEKYFKQIYRVPFPSREFFFKFCLNYFFKAYGIVLSVIAGIVLIFASVGSFFFYKYQKEQKIKNRTLIKPSDLKKIIDDWNEHQNAGLESEWLVRFLLL